MRGRIRAPITLTANPVLIGTITVLIAVITVFMAYNANTGLPFIPTYDIKARVPDAAQLVPGNDVQVGGVRVGLVKKMRPLVAGDGKVAAELDLKLDETLKPLPVDTRVVVRQRSNIGLKYVELLPGRSPRGVPAGGTLALENARLPVGLDELLGVFDKPTRRATAGLIKELGNGLAGRGADLNLALEALPGTLSDLTVVSRLLRAPQTDLHGFITGLASATATLAPVADQAARLFDSGATTFGALARERRAVGASIDETAVTERVGTPALRAARPLLAQATALAREAAPGIAVLPATSDTIARGLRRSGPALGRARQLAAPLEAAVRELRAVSRKRSTTGSLERLTDTVKSLVPALTYINPMQVKCNYLGVWTRNVLSLASEGDVFGTWFRFAPIQKPNEDAQVATPPADYHYGTAPDAGQRGECENGNENYLPGRQVIGTIPGTQPDHSDDTPRGLLGDRVAYESRSAAR